MSEKLDCIVIGYNEIPFQEYEAFLGKYGEDSEAYRDLKYSFVELAGRKMDYVGLLNHVLAQSRNGQLSSAERHTLKSGDIPNLAAVYLTNFLNRRGVEARYVNLFQYEQDKLIDYLASDPVCVAITTTFYVVNLPVNEMVRFIRAQNPGVKIVVGGPLIANHARNNPGEFVRAALDDLGADIYVIEGQGEQTLYDVVECLKSGGDLRGIPNIAFFDGGALKRTITKPENNSLDDNFIDWRKFNTESGFGGTLQTRTARSCSFACSFCNYPTRAGALTLSSLETLEKELDSMKNAGDVRNVVFIDDTFNVPLPRFKNICRLMIEKNYGFNWFSYFRCSNSDDEAFELMAKSGCKGVFLGVESGSPTILKNMSKFATPEKYARGIQRLREHGILTFGSFIIGFPGETESTVRETVDFIRENKPDYYRAQVWYCEPGTPIFQQKEKYQIKGDGFVWTHATMDSLEAMEHIDRSFFSIDESIWLPQWSFDFWIIPYLLGRGISLAQFREFMMFAHNLLRLEIASTPRDQKSRLQQRYFKRIFEQVSGWSPGAMASAA